MSAASAASSTGRRRGATSDGSSPDVASRSIAAVSTGTTDTSATRSRGARSSALQPEQLAWCAGVIDMVGLIKTRPMDTGSELSYVSVSTPRRDILDHLAELTGSGVVIVNRDYKRLGCGEHCTEPHLHVFSTTARWSLTGARAAVFLAAIEPYLMTKATQAQEAVAAGLVAPRKAATLNKMYRLGWPELEAM